MTDPQPREPLREEDEEPIHMMFELTYASYLVLPRSILQSMPVPWQKKFVALMDEIEARFDSFPEKGVYHVYLKDDNGRFLNDPLQAYERGRRRIEPKVADHVS